MSRRRRRLVGALAAGVAVLALAGPAYAQFCWKDGWVEAAREHVLGSQAWLSGDDWKAIIEDLTGSGANEICQAGADILIKAIDEAPADRLYMGPGTLAKGTYKSGNTPSQMGALPFPQAFEACGYTGH